MKKLWSRWRRSPSPADPPRAFQIDEAPDTSLDGASAAELLEQAQRVHGDLLREAQRLRASGQEIQLLQQQLEETRRAGQQLLAEPARLKQELAVVRRTLGDQIEEQQLKRESLLCGIAREVFRFQQTVHHLKERGLDEQLGKEYDRVRVHWRRMERLLRDEGVSIIDPTNREPDGEQMDVMDYVTQPGIPAEVVVTTLEPIVVQAGHIIGRGKVVVALPAEA